MHNPTLMFWRWATEDLGMDSWSIGFSLPFYSPNSIAFTEHSAPFDGSTFLLSIFSRKGFTFRPFGAGSFTFYLVST